MNTPLGQHQIEIERNKRAWQNKPLLRQIYADFYGRILSRLEIGARGRIVEIGSGIGNLKSHLPEALSSDLFPNPWLDLACDGYELPFRSGAISNLILFDVFHHLRAPQAFFNEARRVLAADGKLIVFEPYVSCASYPVYWLLHHEPLGLTEKIDLRANLPRPRQYYAAQGNATRIFFRGENSGLLEGWTVCHAEAFAAFSYLLSGGFSKPCFYPRQFYQVLRRLDQWLTRWPKCFGARCLVELRPKKM